MMIEVQSSEIKMLPLVQGLTSDPWNEMKKIAHIICVSLDSVIESHKVINNSWVAVLIWQIH